MRALIARALDAIGLVSRTQDLKREDRTRDWFNVRGWINRRDWTGPKFSWQACVRPRLTFSAALSRGEERDIGGHLQVLGVAFYWGIEGLGLDGPEREIRLSFHDGLLVWTVWKDPNSWSRADGWRNDSWNVDDFLCGDAKYSSELVEKREVQIPMPEGSYRAFVELKRDRWARPRWPAKEVMRAHVTIPGGIPMEGKGENSYDCDDDAVFAMTAPAGTVEEGIGGVVASVLRDRWKRSRSHGWDRKPEAAE